MNEAAHFANFRRKHRMQVARHIERPSLTSNGHGTDKKMHETLHLPKHLPWGIRFKEWLRHNFGQGWDYVVVNKSVDSVTMPKWVASAILVAVLGFGVSSWWRSSDQRDMLIELKTELRIAKEHEAEKAKELKDQADMNKVYIDNMTNQLNVIRGMLSQQQQNVVGNAQRGNN